jgi:DDE superfamily endonuclease
MTDILALLQPIQNSVSKTTLRQLSRIIIAMIAMTGRVTMLGISRWAEKGGSYRTVQRFFYTVIPGRRYCGRSFVGTFWTAKTPICWQAMNVW